MITSAITLTQVQREWLINYVCEQSFSHVLHVLTAHCKGHERKVFVVSLTITYAL